MHLLARSSQYRVRLVSCLAWQHACMSQLIASAFVQYIFVFHQHFAKSAKIRRSGAYFSNTKSQSNSCVRYRKRNTANALGVLSCMAPLQNRYFAGILNSYIFTIFCTLIFSLLDQKPKQTIGFNGGRAIGNFDGKLLIASPSSVYRLRPISVKVQIEVNRINSQVINEVKVRSIGMCAQNS